MVTSSCKNTSTSKFLIYSGAYLRNCPCYTHRPKKSMHYSKILNIDQDIFPRRIQDFEQQQKKLERCRSSGAVGSNSSNRSSRDMLDTVINFPILLFEDL